MAKGARKKGKPAGRPAGPARPADLPGAKAIAPRRTVEPKVKTSARIEVAVGAVLMLGTAILANTLDGEALTVKGFLAVMVGWALGALDRARCESVRRSGGGLPGTIAGAGFMVSRRCSGSSMLCCGK
jgi:hypothetical protein